VSTNKLERLDGNQLRKALEGALAQVEAKKDTINHLNVFPVPDGDTGTNLLLTLQAALQDAKISSSNGVGSVATGAAHGALMGARGNSGVILSQIFRGMSKALQGLDSANALQFARSLDEAAQAAYRAVVRPTEGTMLTVAREAAKGAIAAAERGGDVLSVLQAAAREAAKAVARTPDQLPILKEANVVDAGGFGLQVILEGMLRALSSDIGYGTENVLPDQLRYGPAALSVPEEGWGYCTEFVIEDPKYPFEEIKQDLTSRGDSCLVVGDQKLVRVHIHTMEPAELIAHATTLGKVRKLKVENMTEQHLTVSQELISRGELPATIGDRDYASTVGVVSVVSGKGMSRIFKSIGVDAVIDGGRTMNPSTEDILNAIKMVDAYNVIVLPNNKNVLLACQQAKSLSDKNVAIIETLSMPEGLAAMVAFKRDLHLSELLDCMTKAIQSVTVIEMAKAIRSTSIYGVQVSKGQVMAIHRDNILATGKTYSEALMLSLSKVSLEGKEILAIYVGEDGDVREAETMAAQVKDMYPDLELEIQVGDQGVYPYIVAIE